MSSSYILRTVRPSAIQTWIAANAPSSLKANGRESWRAFLQANSGTGQGWGDLEASFLTALSKSGGTIHDRWQGQITGTGTGREKARNTYK